MAKCNLQAETFGFHLTTYLPQEISVLRLLPLQNGAGISLSLKHKSELSISPGLYTNKALLKAVVLYL